MNNPFESRAAQHFLFNALNSVIALCYKDPEKAAQLVGEISTYLQRSLEDKTSLIALEEELEHVLAYINIQKTRFSDRLKVFLDIASGIQCLVPPFIIQPIVDNAIVHGVLTRKQGGTVSFSVEKMSSSVRITVEDDGIGMTAEQLGSLFAIQNSNLSVYRIDHALKTAGFKGLEIKSACNEGTTVVMEIPCRPQF